MRLVDLDPAFLAFTDRPGVLRCHSDYLRAQGVYFLCPKCLKENSNDDSPPHSFTLLFPSAPSAAKPEGRWTPTGTEIDDLNLLEAVEGKCGFKGFVLKGRIESLSA